MKNKYISPVVVITVLVIVGGIVAVGGILLRQQVEESGKVTPSEEALFWTPGTRGTASCESHWENISTHRLLSFHVTENVLENVDGVEMY